MSKKTIPFEDDVLIKDCKEDGKDSTLDKDRCRRFVREHIEDIDKILGRIEEVNWTLSIDKSNSEIF